MEKPNKVKIDAIGLPDDISKQWIEKIYENFNNEMKSENGKMISYRYVPTSEYEQWVEYTRLEASGRI